MEENEIELGDIARDTISGLEGVVIARTQWLYNCERLTLQPKDLKDGKPVDCTSFDFQQLELVSKSAKSHAPAENGGPAPEPARRAAPTR